MKIPFVTRSKKDHDASSGILRSIPKAAVMAAAIKKTGEKAGSRARSALPTVRREPEPPKRSPKPWMLGMAAGAALAYFLDPDRGRARRARTKDRTAAVARKAADSARKLGTRAADKAEGLPHELRHPHGDPKPDMDDLTLAHKVESEVIRRPDVDRGKINVNAEHGTVVLRGECDSPDEIREIEARVRQIPEVHDVENLLHVKGTPAQERPEQRIGPPTG